MRTRTVWALAGTVLAASVSAVVASTAVPDAERGGVPDAPAIGSFVEVEDGRTLARLEARFSPTPDGPRLDLRIRAEGSGVDGTSDWTGVPGVNLTTAREIDRLLRTGALTARVRHDGATQGARVDALARRRLPTRVLAPDGSIDFDARTEALPTGLRITTPPLANGRHLVEVLARGTVRLTVDVDVRSDGARLTSMGATGGLHRDLKQIVWEPVR